MVFVWPSFGNRRSKVLQEAFIWILETKTSRSLQKASHNFRAPQAEPPGPGRPSGGSGVPLFRRFKERPPAQSSIFDLRNNENFFSSRKIFFPPAEAWEAWRLWEPFHSLRTPQSLQDTSHSLRALIPKLPQSLSKKHNDFYKVFIKKHWELQ